MLVGDQRHAPAALPLGKRPGTRRTGSLVGPRAGLDSRGYEIFFPVLCLGYLHGHTIT
jgi:hypothetical protein